MDLEVQGASIDQPRTALPGANCDLFRQGIDSRGDTTRAERAGLGWHLVRPRPLPKWLRASIIDSCGLSSHVQRLRVHAQLGAGFGRRNHGMTNLSQRGDRVVPASRGLGDGLQRGSTSYPARRLDAGRVHPANFQHHQLTVGTGQLIGATSTAIPFGSMERRSK